MVKNIATKLRAIVREELPDALEMLDLPDKLIHYGTERTLKGVICYIKPLKDSVNLGFARGTLLPDPAGLLQGTGKFGRHLKFKNVDQVDSDAARKLLQAALAEHQQLSER
jgi:hypothetical protein